MGYCMGFVFNWCCINQGWIQEFQNQGTRSWRGRIFGVGGLFWCPFTYTIYFSSEIREKLHNINIAYWQQLKYMHVLQSKFTIRNPIFFSIRGASAQCACPRSAFVNTYLWLTCEGYSSWCRSRATHTTSLM